MDLKLTALQHYSYKILEIVEIGGAMIEKLKECCTKKIEILCFKRFLENLFDLWYQIWKKIDVVHL